MLLGAVDNAVWRNWRERTQPTLRAVYAEYMVENVVSVS
jgi:hypothetical protein